jgi:hypothetical protein
VDDPGILLDADTPKALVELASYVRETRGVSKSVAQDLFAANNTPSNVIAHTHAVAQLALRMAQNLNLLGFGLDSQLCYSGGELHDLNRVEPDHSKVASAHLRDLGYCALARVVGAHDHELCLEPHVFSEENLVFVADKMIKETSLVSIKSRYAGAVRRFPPNTQIGALIQRDSERAFSLLKRYVELTGDAAVLRGTNDFDREKGGGDHART